MDIGDEAEDAEAAEAAFEDDETGEAADGFSEPEIYDADYDAEDDEFEARRKKRRARIKRRRLRRKILSVIVIIAAFAVLATMCGRDIVKLKAENIALQRRQDELEKERDRLRKEVKNAGNREYVQDQAKKQLRLLNPGELLFTFEDEDK